MRTLESLILSRYFASLRFTTIFATDLVTAPVAETDAAASPAERPAMTVTKVAFLTVCSTWMEGAGFKSPFWGLPPVGSRPLMSRFREVPQRHQRVTRRPSWLSESWARQAPSRPQRLCRRRSLRPWRLQHRAPRPYALCDPARAQFEITAAPVGVQSGDRPDAHAAGVAGLR